MNNENFPTTVFRELEMEEVKLDKMDYASKNDNTFQGGSVHELHHIRLMMKQVVSQLSIIASVIKEAADGQARRR